MNKQGEHSIGWCDYTWNPITGCLNHVNGLCKGGGFPCYAHKIAWRFKERYLANKNLSHDYLSIGKAFNRGPEPFADPFYPRLWPERLHELGSAYDWNHKVKPRRIFVCDMSDLFGIGIPEEWTRDVLEVIHHWPEHTFQLLTKQPQNLAKWSPFPENCWVGVTATDVLRAYEAIAYLENIEAKIKYLSIEPLLYGGAIVTGGLPVTWDAVRFNSINWVIIGLQTPYSPKTAPRIEHVQEIVEAADKAGIPVFLKENLKPLLEEAPLGSLYWANVSDDERGHERVDDKLRQEFPTQRVGMKTKEATE